MNKINDFLNEFSEQESKKKQAVEDTVKKLQEEAQKVVLFEQAFRKHYTSVITPTLFKIKSVLKNQFDVEIDQSLRKDKTSIGVFTPEFGEVNISSKNNLTLTIKITTKSSNEKIRFELKTSKVLLNNNITSVYEFDIYELDAAKIEETMMKILNDVYIEKK